MNKYLAIFACLLFLTGCSATEPVQNIRSVPPAEFKTMAQTNEYIVVDVRTPEELLPSNGGKLFKEALNIDFYEPDFTAKLQALDPNKKYLIYCRSGNRTSKTLVLMKQAGFSDVADLAGGKKAWDKFYNNQP